MRKRIAKFFKKLFKNSNGNVLVQNQNPLDENYLFDFKTNYSGGFSMNDGDEIITVFDQENAVSENSDGTISMRTARNAIKPKITKISVKPKDVLDELETVPTPFSLNGLPEKIHILKEKEKLIKQYYSKREVSGLIERLENRKKYLKHKMFFDNFANTTDEKIDALLKKYALVMKESDIFIPEFPDEAIKVMKEYTKKVKQICKKNPVFYVIAEEKLFKKAYEKRDPILLVQSPFGFYWQILGAWDEEMVLLQQL